MPRHRSSSALFGSDLEPLRERRDGFAKLPRTGLINAEVVPEVYPSRLPGLPGAAARRRARRVQSRPTGVDHGSTFGHARRGCRVGIPGHDTGSAVGIVQLGCEVPRAAPAIEHPRVDGALERPAASCRVTVRQRQRRMDVGPLQGVGLGRGNRNLQRPVSNADGARARTARADALYGDARRTTAADGSDVRTEGRAAADLQRLFD